MRVKQLGHFSRKDFRLGNIEQFLGPVVNLVEAQEPGCGRYASDVL